MNRRSITGFAVFLEGAPISAISLMHKIDALSVTEAETINWGNLYSGDAYCIQNHYINGLES
jgi:hypothetical protein